MSISAQWKPSAIRNGLGIAFICPLAQFTFLTDGNEEGGLFPARKQRLSLHQFGAALCFCSVCSQRAGDSKCTLWHRGCRKDKLSKHPPTLRHVAVIMLSPPQCDRMWLNNRVSQGFWAKDFLRPLCTQSNAEKQQWECFRRVGTVSNELNQEWSRFSNFWTTWNQQVFLCTKRVKKQRLKLTVLSSQSKKVCIGEDVSVGRLS